MSISVQAGSTLTFEKFWTWLLHHPNCILRAGTVDAVLYDQEDFHWHFEEDGHRNPSIQLIRGKQLIAEMVIEVREVLFVTATPDSSSGEQGAFLFEVVGGPKDSSFPMAHFVLSHGFDEQDPAHSGGLKH